jgi:hypothetical protein
MLSPSGILAAGAGLAVGVVVGLPVVVAVGAGAVAWAARVGLAMPKQAARPRIDPSAVSEPWRGFVKAALSAKARFDRAVRSTKAGPLRDRLGMVGERIETGVDECWRIAGQGHDIDAALATLDTTQARRELTELSGATGDSASRTADALRAQIASQERLARVSADARDRLRLLDARLDELVARAVELSVSAGDLSDLGGLDSDVDGLVTQMEALRQAIEETNQPPSGPAQ